MGKKLDQISNTLAVVVIVVLSVALINRLNSLFLANKAFDYWHEYEEGKEQDTNMLRQRSLGPSPPKESKGEDDDCRFGFHFLRSIVKEGNGQTRKGTSRVTIKRPVSGALRQKKMCMDSMDGGIDSAVGMYECHGQGRNQEWTLTKTMLIESNGQTKLCLTNDVTRGSSVVMTPCNASDGNQKWIINAEKGKINPLKDQFVCMDSSNDLVTLEKCSANRKAQKWSFIVTEILSLEIQSQNHV